jgi:crossover junction endodeoxyribonuclease RusA
MENETRKILRIEFSESDDSARPMGEQMKAIKRSEADVMKSVHIKFTVYARPQPQGSIRAFTPKGWKRPVLTSTNKDLKPFRQELSMVALAAMRDIGAEPIPFKSPVRLIANFYFHRPKSKSKKAYVVVQPDIDKLVRAVSDSLSGICYHDDSQITKLQAEKWYGEPERIEIEVEGWEVH